MSWFYNAAFAAVLIVVSSNGVAAQTADDVSHQFESLKQKNAALEKKNAALNKENYVLRERLQRVEGSANDRKTAPVLPPMTMAMADKAEPHKAVTSPVPFNWTGFYAGGHAGYGVTHIIPPQIPDLFGPAQPDGGFWGGQIGFNYQVTQTWVIGAELDAAFARMEKTLIGPEPLLPQTMLATTTKVEALASARARVGKVFDRTLLYATGGAGWGRFDLVTSSSNSSPGPGNPQVGDSRRTLTGWTAGAGLEALLWSNWTGKIEYLYYRFPPASFTNFNGATIPPSGGAEIHTVRLGMNWLFQ